MESAVSYSYSLRGRYYNGYLVDEYWVNKSVSIHVNHQKRDQGEICVYCTKLVMEVK